MKFLVGNNCPVISVLLSMKCTPQILLTLILSTAGFATTEKATVGAGCFWCVEAVYEQLPGVLDVVSGYAGGPEKSPTYNQVSAGRTGHAEVVQITFDPEKTSYRDLIDYFWKTHDVTDPRGVWPDFGPHYRSIILVHNDEQLEEARASRAIARENHEKPVITEIVKLKKFYPAEDYHQDYVRLNPRNSYVRNIAYKKLDKLGLKRP